MYFEIIKGLLPRRETRQVVELSQRMAFVDGREASNPGSSVKHNLQADIQDPIYAEAGKIVQKAIYRSQVFKDYAMPKSMAMPMVCKYQPGMEYGFHVDSALLATKPPMRADVSITVFLSDPETYDGGELVAKMGDKEIEVKLNSGDAVVYPSLTLHRVKPVTRGVRLVSITFAESMIRDHYQRELLYQLGKAIDREADKLSFETMTELTNVHTNLQRYWMER
ncbi:MAG: Fe2+-dependent dioxygenase [Proteobacteria bacterium]|nr:Fe2+-dependent dioxygenase [Pseudomonadota bacterium]MCH7805965.1 Fe2+-dependent dioxygenase [Pseudomonadota bacterium]MCH8082531.1 Fe2+-dependent dioxygenase [Pseudomonadota bacterium]MCH8172950.1 Fe2+-dependent dioxygenase [Pseudomonadota bacterium]